MQRHEQHNGSVKNGRYHIVAGDVEEVLEVLVSTSKQGPHRAGAFVDVLRLPLASVVTQEGAVKTRVSVLHQLDLDTRGRRSLSSAFDISIVLCLLNITSDGYETSNKISNSCLPAFSFTLQFHVIPSQMSPTLRQMYGFVMRKRKVVTGHPPGRPR